LLQLIYGLALELGADFFTPILKLCQKTLVVCQKLPVFPVANKDHRSHILCGVGDVHISFAQGKDKNIRGGVCQSLSYAVFRNNIIDVGTYVDTPTPAAGTKDAIGIDDDVDVAGSGDYIDVYNNTGVYQGTGLLGAVFRYNPGSGLGESNNNIGYAPSTTTASGSTDTVDVGATTNTDGTGNRTDNLVKTDPGFVNTSGTLSEASDFALEEGSVAIGAGEAVPVYYDYNGKWRESNDQGAIVSQGHYKGIGISGATAR